MTTETRYAVVRRKHWLARPENIRKLWWLFGAILVATVAVQAFVRVYGHYEVEAEFGFSAAYGFFTCVAMVIFAKILGWWLKRSDEYYPEESLFLWTAAFEPAPPWPEGEEEDLDV